MRWPGKRPLSPGLANTAGAPLAASPARRASSAGKLVGLSEDRGHVELLVRMPGGTGARVELDTPVDRLAATRHTPGYGDCCAWTSI